MNRHKQRGNNCRWQPRNEHNNGFSMVDPSATKAPGSCRDSWDLVKGSTGNEPPASAKICQSPKISSSLLSDSSSLPTDVLSFSVRVGEEENLSTTVNIQSSPETPENKIPGGCSSKVYTSTPLRSGIYKVRIRAPMALKPSLQKGSAILRPGMVLLKNHFNHADQIKIIKVCRDLGSGAGGFYQPGFENGAKMNLQMMCLGMDWDPERKVYQNRRSVDDAVPPGIPDVFKQMVKRAITQSQGLIKEKHNKCNPEDVIPSMQPDICIVNFYLNTGYLGLHQDEDESKESLYNGLPVVSISIGDSANFLYYGEHGDVGGGTEIVLESGDVLIFGGKSRHIFHGVTSILPDTASKALAAEANLRPGRLNLTFKKY